MTAKLISFMFLGILLAMAYQLGVGMVYARFFAASIFFQTFWFVPFALIPGLLLLALAWGVGFFRRGGKRVQDVLAALVLAAIVILTIPASYSCGATGCF